jgi:hypothetical protein
MLGQLQLPIHVGPIAAANTRTTIASVPEEYYKANSSLLFSNLILYSVPPVPFKVQHIGAGTVMIKLAACRPILWT